MNCYVRWNNEGEWKGPYNKVFWPFAYDAVNQVEIDDIDKGYVVVPKSWTIGIDDGWTLWQGGDCPVDRDVIVKCVFRDGDACSGVAHSWLWDHNAGRTDIIAYRVVEQDNRIMTRDEVLWFVANTPGMLARLSEDSTWFNASHMGIHYQIVKYQWCIPSKPGDYSDVHQFEVDPEGYIVGDPQGRKV